MGDGQSSEKREAGQSNVTGSASYGDVDGSRISAGEAERGRGEETNSVVEEVEVENKKRDGDELLRHSVGEVDSGGEGGEV